MEERKETCEQKEELNQIVELGSELCKNNKSNIYTLTIIGQVEGHQVLPETVKYTMYSIWAAATAICRALVDLLKEWKWTKSLSVWKVSTVV